MVLGTGPKSMEIQGIPPYVASWSAAGIPGFVPAVLDRWRRNYGDLPRRFVMVLCPQVEINAIGGLPGRVRELTSPRLRMQHFTGCHKPYVVLIHAGEDAEGWRDEVQGMLSWSEGYQVEVTEEMTRLQFIDAIEERDDGLELAGRRAGELQEAVAGGRTPSVDPASELRAPRSEWNRSPPVNGAGTDRRSRRSAGDSSRGSDKSADPVRRSG